METCQCIESEILKTKLHVGERVRIQTESRSTYEGFIEDMDCHGVLFDPDDPRHPNIEPAYILFNDIRKFMLPEHKQSD